MTDFILIRDVVVVSAVLRLLVVTPLLVAHVVLTGSFWSSIREQ